MAVELFFVAAFFADTKKAGTYSPTQCEKGGELGGYVSAPFCNYWGTPK
jgi:hypothetical protein